MRTADAILPLVVSLSALACPMQSQATSPSSSCGDVEKRVRFDAAQITQDVAAYDTDLDLVMTEAEYRNYLLACDRGVRGKAGDAEKAKEILDILIDIVTSREGADCEENPERCAYDRQPLHVVQAYSVARDGDLFVAFEPKPDDVVRHISVGRSLLDAADPLASDPVATVPFLLSYTRDYAAREETGLLLGKVSYGPWFWGDRWDAHVSATADVDTGDEPEESSMAFGATATYTRAFDGNGFAVSITPEYGTDGNGDRDVVTLRTQLSVAGTAFLGAGQWTPLGVGYFGWDPSLALYCGEVRDDGGNEELARIAEQGAYCRVQPAVQMRWRTDRLARHAFGMRLGYGQTYDLQDRWDRGYGEVEASLGAKGSPLQLILLYREGRKAPTFEEERALVFGIGIQL